LEPKKTSFPNTRDMTVETKIWRSHHA